MGGGFTHIKEYELSWPVWSSKSWKVTQKYIPSSFKEITISSKDLKSKCSRPIDGMHIFIENVFFPMNMKGMVTRKLATKTADIPILMPNESLGDMCLYYICEKIPVPEKDICITRRIKWPQIEKSTYIAINEWELEM